MSEMSEASMPMAQGPVRPTCGALTKARTPCRIFLNLSPTTGRCLTHDEERAEQRRAMHAAGGNAKSAQGRRAKAARAEAGEPGASADGTPASIPAAPTSLEAIPRFLASVMNALARGTVDVKTGHELVLGAREQRLALENAMSAEVAELRAEVARMKRERLTGAPVGAPAGPRLA